MAFDLLKKYSRRRFLETLGIGVPGLLISNSVLAKGIKNLISYNNPGNQAVVAATVADNYERSFIKQKVQHLFESLGGIGDIVQPGSKVGIKINLTGGSSWANHSQLNGVDIRECAWTHPEVLRAVGELLMDSGVNGSDIYFVEAIWDPDSYNQYGYKDVQEYLGAQVINLNTQAPYPAFINKLTGSNYFFYSSFILNQILNDIDVLVSIPKMKQHYNAGVTHSMKNLVGIVPLQHYQMPSQQGIRSKIHVEGGDIGYHLPRSICDLNMASPVHLAVIDGVKNAVGGEGPWNPTFTPYEHNALLAGKDPVATDSVATSIMGINPETEQFELPSGLFCDNHLHLAKQKNMGTNLLNEIQLVGDGAGFFGIDDYDVITQNNIRLYQNYPNPFTNTTTIRFYIPQSEKVALRIFNQSGLEIETLVEGRFSAGHHEIKWAANNLSEGIFFYTLNANGQSLSRKLIYQK